MKHATAHAFTSPDLSRQIRLDTLEDQITELATHIHAATFRLLELSREFDERMDDQMAVEGLLQREFCLSSQKRML